MATPGGLAEAVSRLGSTPTEQSSDAETRAGIQRVRLPHLPVILGEERRELRAVCRGLLEGVTHARGAAVTVFEIGDPPVRACQLTVRMPGLEGP